MDFWTIGVFLYEINAGVAPFADDNPAVQYDKIVKGKFQCPPTFTRELTDIINKLIVVDRSSRCDNRLKKKFIKKLIALSSTDWVV